MRSKDAPCHTILIFVVFQEVILLFIIRAVKQYVILFSIQDEYTDIRGVHRDFDSVHGDTDILINDPVTVVILGFARFAHRHVHILADARDRTGKGLRV